MSETSALLQAYATNDAANRYLLANVAPEAWDLKMPGGKGRTVGGMFLHIHNVRMMWHKVPKAGEPFSIDDARVALAESHAPTSACGSGAR